MKKLSLFIFAVLVAASFTNSADARYGKKYKGGEAGYKNGGKRQYFKMKYMDENQDGEVSFEEFEAHHKARKGTKEFRQEQFKMLDADKDGQISKTEFVNGVPAKTRFNSIDANNDGKITEAEFDKHREVKKAKKKGFWKKFKGWFSSDEKEEGNKDK